MPPRPRPVLCLGNSVRALSRQAKRHEFMFDEATASLAQIDDEGAAVCCVEEEDAARVVVGRLVPPIIFRCTGCDYPSASRRASSSSVSASMNSSRSPSKISGSRLRVRLTRWSVTRFSRKL